MLDHVAVVLHGSREALEIDDHRRVANVLVVERRAFHGVRLLCRVGVRCGANGSGQRGGPTCIRTVGAAGPSPDRNTAIAQPGRARRSPGEPRYRGRHRRAATKPMPMRLSSSGDQQALVMTALPSSRRPGHTELGLGILRRQEADEAARRLLPALRAQCRCAVKLPPIEIHESREPELERRHGRGELAREQDMTGLDSQRVDGVESAFDEARVPARFEERLPQRRRRRVGDHQLVAGLTAVAEPRDPAFGIRRTSLARIRNRAARRARFPGNTVRSCAG